MGNKQSIENNDNKNNKDNNKIILGDFKQIYEINFLPGTVLLKIFSMVNENDKPNELPSQSFYQLSLVCKLWRYYNFHSINSIKMVPERLENLLIPYKQSVLDQAFLSIQQIIENSTTLTTLDFSNIEIDKKRASLISMSLETNSTILSMNFEYCYLDNDSIIQLCRGLEKNKSIIELDFNNNKIGPQGALAIANMLKVNKSIETINLSNNEIGNQGAMSMADILKTTKRNVKLNLSSNHIGDEGVLAIVKARQQNNNGAKTSFIYKSGLKFTTVNGKSTVVCP
ncbi:hypothetical protein DDB_G0285563 [Dictyostelium discoideum AX4]|uniref:Uncharacterized protein n=1 Tax=Dictyostelium discoideum TaxID=44689 RepID=Q54N16_DICDI|nr:hypothetical protein DDB_G0285563 [Dictyostelium discoideum AX4]EAL64619.1 hypothetical protein DDB_G0285563 [Dictyostelium discoideum AX4]|eukprot:XP_638127.1 hypothetical protein DDB_G0285563 [Dictyostelium discoideum AX4]